MKTKVLTDRFQRSIGNKWKKKFLNSNKDAKKNSSIIDRAIVVICRQDFPFSSSLTTSKC